MNGGARQDRLQAITSDDVTRFLALEGGERWDFAAKFVSRQGCQNSSHSGGGGIRATVERFLPSLQDGLMQAAFFPVVSLRSTTG